MPLILYRRDGCHLCDHAEEALRGAGVDAFVAVEIGWTGGDSERFGARIPVLVHSETGAELDWPFDVWTVRKFLGGA